MRVLVSYIPKPFDDTCLVYLIQRGGSFQLIPIEEEEEE
jgi:hypothetical protein